MPMYKLRTFLLGGIWFARLDTFGDPLEGTLPRADAMGLLQKHPAPDARWLREEYERNGRRTYASCWHMSDGDPSDAVWDKFSKDDDAVAIKTTVGRIDRELAHLLGGGVGSGPLHRGAVDYIDHHIHSIPEGNLLEAVFAIRDSFADEVEARYVLFTHGTAAAERLYHGPPGPFGNMVEAVSGAASVSGMTEFQAAHSNGTAIVPSVDPSRIIVEVLAGPRTSLSFRYRIARELWRHRLLRRFRYRRARP